MQMLKLDSCKMLTLTLCHKSIFGKAKIVFLVNFCSTWSLQEYSRTKMFFFNLKGYLFLYACEMLHCSFSNSIPQYAAKSVWKSFFLHMTLKVVFKQNLLKRKLNIHKRKALIRCLDKKQVWYTVLSSYLDAKKMNMWCFFSF